MQALVFPSFKNILQRLKRYLILNDGYNYTNPIKLLGMYQRLEDSKAKTLDMSAAQVNSIVVLRTDKDERFTVILRKPVEAKPEDMEISVFSPLGSALLGAQANDQCKVKVHGMQQTFTVTQIIN